MTIGILGGIGPKASALFYFDLVKRFQESFHPANNTSFPRFVINSIPAEEIISGANSSKIQKYVKGLKFLEEESDIICIVCNTAYVYYDFFAEKISKPILDLRKIVYNHLSRQNIKTVTILGTPTAYRNNLYNFDTYKYNSLNNEEKKSLEKIIFKINIGRETSKETDFVKKLFRKYEDISDAVVIGCTEITQALDRIKSEKKIDPMDLLIDAVLNEHAKQYNLLKISKSKIHGKGIFTSKVIKKGDCFYIVPTKKIVFVATRNLARIGNRKWVSDEKVLNFVNHSCEPNARLDVSRVQPRLIAINDIMVDQEITVDYNLTEIGGNKTTCKCKSKNCRGYFIRTG